jgi:SAM-dependent methyltransferase
VADQQRTELLDNDALLASAVVANCIMNRERQLTGVNSYARELGFNPVDVIAARLACAGPGGRVCAGAVGWLDLCCGTGRALIQAIEELDRMRFAQHAVLVGVDLVDAFDAVAPGAGVELVSAPVDSWAATRRFDLITCVHGLHYVGDKLAVLSRAARWLTDTGRFVADLDLSSIRLADGRTAGRRLTTRLRAAGFTYDPRRHRISRVGPAKVDLPYTYLGADDRAGPNYTGQPAAHSYYREDDLPGQPTAASTVTPRCTLD